MICRRGKIWLVKSLLRKWSDSHPVVSSLGMLILKTEDQVQGLIFFFCFVLLFIQMRSNILTIVLFWIITYCVWVIYYFFVLVITTCSENKLSSLMNTINEIPSKQFIFCCKFGKFMRYLLFLYFFFCEYILNLRQLCT